VICHTTVTTKTDLGVGGEIVETRLPLARDSVGAAGRHQQVVDVFVQQVSLQIFRPPEAAQAVKILHTHTHTALSNSRSLGFTPRSTQKLVKLQTLFPANLLAETAHTNDLY